LIGTIAIAVLLTTPTAGAWACSKVASPAGSDLGTGSEESPYRSAQRLVDTLEPGQTACLRGGDYGEDVVTLSVPDTRLTSYPGERATLVGRLRVVGDRVMVDHLALDGRNSRNLPSPTINADDVAFRNNDVSSPGGGVCFILGSTVEVQRPVLDRNRIHDCGQPATLYGHGVSMQNVDAALIASNTIYDNPQRGIKMGPDVQGSLIRGNVIDGNGIGLSLSGNGERASSNNVVERNVIANSTHGWNVQSYWPLELVGTGNEVRYNCVHGSNADPYYNSNGGISPGRGFTAHHNLIAEPRYGDRAAKDFRLSDDSPCRQVFASADAVRPYDPASPWNTPIPAGTPVDPMSEIWMNAIADNGLPLTSDADQHAIPVYISDESAPLRSVKLSGYYSTYDAGDDSRKGYGFAPLITGVPIPANARQSAGSDGQITIWDPLSGTEYSFWQFATDAEGNYTASNGYRYHTSPGYFGRFADGRSGRGAGTPYFAGLVRKWEIDQGRIDHALAFAYRSPAPEFRFPASKSDGKGIAGIDAPEGARIQLDPTLTEADFDAWGLSRPAKIIARALQEYGMYVVDNSGSSKIFLEDRITAGWGPEIDRNLPSNIPWSAFRVVTAPTP